MDKCVTGCGYVSDDMDRQSFVEICPYDNTTVDIVRMLVSYNICLLQKLTQYSQIATNEIRKRLVGDIDGPHYGHKVYQYEFLAGKK